MKGIFLALLLLPVLALAQLQNETPQQRAARFEVYCVSQPLALRNECRVQARAAVQLYTADYNAAMANQSQQQLEQIRRDREEILNSRRR